MRKLLLLLLVLVALLLSACGNRVPAPASYVTPMPEITVTPEPTPEVTPEPTPIPPITILGVVYNHDTEVVDLSSITPDDVKAIAALLPEFPNLKKINLMSEDGVCALEAPEIAPLYVVAPEVEYICSFDLFGKTATNETTELRYEDLSLSATDIDIFRTALPYLSSLEMLRVGHSKVDNDAMDALRSEFPEKNIIWSVFFCDHYWMTDTTLVNSTLLNDSNVHYLQYLHDVLYVDVGHDHKLSNIDFVRNFPKLTTIIISLSVIDDLTPLADCPELEFIETFTTKISDLSPLSGLTKLEYLNIGNNEGLYDLSPLYGLTSLKLLRICGPNKIPAEQLDTIRSLLPNTEINTRGGHSANSGHWRYENDDQVHRTPRYELLRQQMMYDTPWEKRQSNSPSELGN